MSDYRVFVRDASLELIGALDTELDLTMVLRHNGAGTWVMKLPGDTAQAGLLTPGCGIVVYREGESVPVLSGPMRRPQRESRDGRSTSLLTVSGIDDTARLGLRVVYPLPSAAVTAQTDAYRVKSGAAETVIRAYINENAGPGATSGRPLTGLALTADLARGGSVKASARFDQLLALCNSLALTADINFRIVQVGAALQLLFSEPVDRSATVRLSPEAGNLAAWSYGLTAPDITRVIVGGGGVGTARTFRLRSATAAESDWSERAESFVDQRQTTDAAELDQAGDEALVSGAATAGLSVSPLDIPGCRYGVDYFLGDTVTAVVDGVEIPDVVRQVTIQVGEGSATVTPILGDPDSSSDTPTMYARLRSLSRRLAFLERRS